MDSELENNTTTLFRTIPFTQRVLKSGKEPVPRASKKKQQPRPPGIIDSTITQLKQDSPLFALWRWGETRQARIFGQRAPDGWSPSSNISGFFKNYEDYLTQAQNPEELELRKQYVIQRMNYERTLAQIGTTKRIGSAILAQFIDPVTLVFMGASGVVGKVGTLAATGLGAGRIAEGVLSGALIGGAYNLLETTFKRSLDSEVQSPEYAPMEGMLFGGVLGGALGYLSESAGYARFKMQHGSEDYRLYKAMDLEMRRLEHGTTGTGDNVPLSAAERLDRRQYINEQVQRYIAGDLDATKYRAFDIGAAVDRERMIGKCMGVFGLGEEKSVNALANGLNRMRTIFSNQMNMLGSKLESMRVAGMKIFPTTTYEKHLAAAVGDGAPLVPLVAQANARSNIRIIKAWRDGYKFARQNGYTGTKGEYSAAIFDALQDRSYYDNLTNPAMRQVVDEFNSVNRQAAEWLYNNEGFEFQKIRRENYESAVRELLADAEKQYGFTAADVSSNVSADVSTGVTSGNAASFHVPLARYRYVFNKLKKDFEADMSGGLDKSVERFGGTYFPRELDGLKIQADMTGAQEAVYASMLRAEENYAKKVATDVLRDMDMSMDLKGYKNAAEYWEAFNGELQRFDLKNAFMPGTPDSGHIRVSDLQLSADYLTKIRALARERIRRAVDRSYSLASGSAHGTDIRIRDALERAYTPAEIHPRGAAKHRHYRDDYSIIRPYLRDDLMEMETRYINGMHSSAGMIQTFGDENGERLVDGIVADYRRQLDNIASLGHSPEETTRMSATLRRDVRDGLRSLEAAINHVKGYGSTVWEGLGGGTTSRIASVMSNWNVARYLSDSVFSQLQDQANVALHLNGWRSFGQSFINFAKLLHNASYREELVTLARELGIASDLYMKSQRAHQLVTVAEHAGFLGGVDKFFSKAADAAMKYSGTGMLDGWTQTNASYMAACELDRAASTLLNGKKLSSFQTRFLSDAGISSKKLSQIGEQIARHATREDGVLQLNLGKWGSQVVADDVRALLYRHGSAATMVPGADLPPIFRNPLGKLLLQFRSFTTATFNRMFMYSLENGQQFPATTIAQCMILDTIGKMCKNIGRFGTQYGADPVTNKLREYDYFDMAMRSFNDSLRGNDWASWCFDPLGLMQAITSPHSFSNQFGGVSAALIRDIGGGFRYLESKLSGGALSPQDEKMAWRLVPFQNYFITRMGVLAWRKSLRNNTSEMIHRRTANE